MVLLAGAPDWWLICFRFVRFERIGIRWGGCLIVIMLNEIRWYWHLIINFLSRAQCMNSITLIHWLTSAKWACWEFLGFVIGWLGKVPFCLSFVGVASWLIWTSSLCIVCMRESWFFMYLFMFSQSQSFSFLVEDFGRKIVELGWESFVDSLKS